MKFLEFNWGGFSSIDKISRYCKELTGEEYPYFFNTPIEEGMKERIIQPTKNQLRKELTEK